MFPTLNERFNVELLLGFEHKPYILFKKSKQTPFTTRQTKAKHNKTKQNTQAQMWGFGKYTPKKTSFLQEGGKNQLDSQSRIFSIIGHLTLTLLIE